METEFVTVRLTKDEADCMRRLREATGLSKTEIIRKALRTLASDRTEMGAGVGLFDLGASRFGKHGDARRQSSKIGHIARTRANAKRTGR
ncbi:MAG: ribbon-helix-helix domain-containing protein [Burkholderiales bacterium]